MPPPVDPFESAAAEVFPQPAAVHAGSHLVPFRRRRVQ